MTNILIIILLTIYIKLECIITQLNFVYHSYKYNLESWQNAIIVILS